MIIIGDLNENQIGSNCGQHIMHYIDSQEKLDTAYTYRLEEIN